MNSLWGGSKKTTFKPVKQHKEGSKRAQLSSHTRKTLGLGIMKQAVILPENESREEWMAANIVDFFNALSLIYGIVSDKSAPMGVGEGFPPGYEYLWAPLNSKRPQKCSGPEYIEHILDWIDTMVNDESEFPILPSQPFKKDFEKTAKSMFKRMFRCYAILYTNYFEQAVSLRADAHLNTTFKHFCYFIFEFDLVEQRELEALEDSVNKLRSEFESGRG